MHESREYDGTGAEANNHSRDSTLLLQDANLLTLATVRG
jgi:hypothetical protein